MLEHFINGFLQVMTPYTILLVASGVFLGLILGAVPGLTATLGVALLLPITFGLDPVVGQSMLIGVFVGGISGGLVSATLLGVPGTPSSIATTFDAFPMAKNGQPKRALNIGINSSFVGGVVSGLLLVLVSTQLARVALIFTPFEYFLVAVFGMTIIVSLGSKDVPKAMFAASFGLFLSLFGMDPIDGVERFTFGTRWLEKGFGLIPSLLGLFVFPQLLGEIKNLSNKFFFEVNDQGKASNFGIGEMLKHWKNYLASSLIGTGLGILPGVGGAIANFVCYDQAKKSSHYPEKFGTGIPDGIVASETGNNATTGGALVPMLTLGIPGDAVTSIILGGLMIHGIQPGPLLFMEQVNLVYGIFVAFFVANIFMLVFQKYFGIKMFLMALRAPKNYLIPVVMVMCVGGVFALENQVSDIWVFFLFGGVGYVMSRFKFPIQATVLGIILGPIMEKNLRTALMYSNGDLTPFFTKPICLGIIACTVLSLWLSIRLNKRSMQMGRNK